MIDTIYMRKQFPVRGRTVTEENLAEVAKWCGGQALEDDGRHYIWVPAENARHRSQTEANIGDTILKSRRDDRRKGGTRFIFKVYRPEWLEKEFDVMDPEIVAFLQDEADTAEEVHEAGPSPAPRQKPAHLRAVNT